MNLQEFYENLLGKPQYVVGEHVLHHDKECEVTGIVYTSVQAADHLEMDRKYLLDHNPYYQVSADDLEPCVVGFKHEEDEEEAE